MENQEVNPLSESGTKEESPQPAPLLDEAATARLREPILQGEEREREVAARREQKSADAKQLKDTLRLAELRVIPKLRRTVDEQREFSRLEQRQRRVREKTGLRKGSLSPSLSKIETQEEFWRLNRATVDGKKLHDWKAQAELVLDQIAWMVSGWRYTPPDPDFVSLEEGVADLESFVKAHGLIHDDVYQSPFLQGYRPYWGVWASKVIHDPIWVTVSAYWRDTERFHALCGESEATMIYAKFGIRTAMSAYHLRMFKSRIAAHKNLLGRKAHLEYDFEHCWLCQFERLHGEVRR